MCRRLAFLVVLSALAAPSLAEEFTVATYNIENFDTNFRGFHMKQAARKEPTADPTAKAAQDEAIKEEDEQNQEDQWEIAETILDPAFSPDILMIQEGPFQSDLEYFNKRWLKGAYETVLQLPTNVNPKRPQTLCVMMKPGFKILDKRDQYYLEEDTIKNDRGNRLFARGPSFLKVQTPGGYVFWIGNTHQKSKGIRLPSVATTQAAADAAEPEIPAADAAENKERDEPESQKELRARMEREANDWRIREAIRTHAIIKEIEAAGPSDVMLVGDMNDDLGMDKNEQVVGKDGIAEVVGPPADKLHLVTQKLADEKAISFGGYWRPRYRSLIDHVIVTDSMNPKVSDVHVFTGSLAKVASDHFPVIVKVNGTPSVAAQP